MAGGYDGEIRIRTLIENGKASSQLLQLEARFQKLTSEAKNLADAGITASYRSDAADGTDEDSDRGVSASTRAA